jgi:hypothetical protein
MPNCIEEIADIEKRSARSAVASYTPPPVVSWLNPLPPGKPQITETLSRNLPKKSKRPLSPWERAGGEGWRSQWVS